MHGPWIIELLTCNNLYIVSYRLSNYCYIGGCFELQTLGINSSDSWCIKPAGYQVIIECEPGEYPEEFLSTCQEDGRWIPDTTGCSGK